MKPEDFFDRIKDGKCHNIPELASQIKSQMDKLTEFLQFLAKQGIIEYEEKNQIIRIKPEWKELIPDYNENTN